MPESENEGFAEHTFESTGDVLEDHDPEVLPLPTEQHPVTGEPRTLLQRTPGVTITDDDLARS